MVLWKDQCNLGWLNIGFHEFSFNALELKFPLGQDQSHTSCTQTHGELQSSEFICSFLNQQQWHTIATVIAFHLATGQFHSRWSPTAQLWMLELISFHTNQSACIQHFKIVHFFPYMIKEYQCLFLFLSEINLNSIPMSLILISIRFYLIREYQCILFLLSEHNSNIISMSLIFQFFI